MDLSTLLKYSRKNLKLIIIVVLCCALIAGGIKSVSNYTNRSANSQSEQELREKLVQLDKQRQSVLSQMDDLDEYIKIINSSNFLQYTSIYYIDRNVMVYSAVANDINLLQNIITNTKIDIPYNIVKMLIDISPKYTSKDNEENKMLSITISAKDSEQLGQLKTIALQCFEKAQQDIKTSIGTSNIYMLYEQQSVSSNEIIVSLQKQYTDSYSTLSTSLKNLEIQYVETKDAIAASNYSVLSKSVLEYTLLGFILGVFLAYVFILSKFYLSRKLIGIEQILPTIPLLASGKDAITASNTAIVPVIYACGNTTEPIGVVSSDNLSQTKEVYDYLTSNTDYKLNHLGNIFASPNIAKTLLECKGIILVEKYKVSNIKSIESLLDVCKNNNIKIYGAIIIE